MRVRTLASTAEALQLGLSHRNVQAVVDQLTAQGIVIVTGAKVLYKL